MIRAIFMWPRNENVQTKQKQQTRTLSDLIGLSNGYKWVYSRELSRNQPILCFDIILQHDLPIKQCLLHIRVLSGGKTKRPWFDLFIHLMLKQITNTYRNHFSRSYENRSISTSYCHSQNLQLVNVSSHL